MVLKVKKNVGDINFVKYLISEVQPYFTQRLSSDKGKVDSWTKYLNEHITLRTPKKNGVSARDILISGIYNLRVSVVNDSYVIEISPNEILPGTNIKISTLCRIVNYGTLEQPAYNIFTKVFKYFETNVYTYLQKYQGEELL